MTPTPSVLRVANCSGFFGDRLSAAEEMVSGGPIDVLTGDWLAELTMYILHKTRERSGGYARTFLRQLEEVLPACLERGITIVSNAGGLNPEGLAAAVSELARRQGLDVRVASISGDDITDRVPTLQAGGWPFVNLDTDEPLPPDAQLVTANAYLGARPIADALGAGAQVVVTGRVTDASVIVGPALHAFGWRDGDLDHIAGAVVAGHVIECGAQCCGGNYAFFDEIPDPSHIGFPIAELHPDGSSVITKHPGTGGAVTVGTVTAQLLYEIAGPRYLSPDAVARFDTIALEQEGPDRVRIAGVVGEPPPPTLKVTANLEGGWRNSMTMAITGALVEQKARLAADTVWAGIPAGRASFSETSEDLSGDLSGESMAFLRLAVRGDDEASVGRAFSGAVVETSLASYPGTFFTSAPTPAQAVARYWPTTVAADEVTPHVACDGAAIAQFAATPPRRTDASGRADVRSHPSHRSHPSLPLRFSRGGIGHRAALGPRWGPIGRQRWGRQRRAVGRQRPGGSMAARNLRGRPVPRGPARGGRLRGQSISASQPPCRQLRRAWHLGLGCGFKPSFGHPGQGAGRTHPIAALLGAPRTGLDGTSGRAFGRARWGRAR